MNYAILLSGGKGTRVGGDIPKQYTLVAGRMMITYAFEALIRSEDVDRIVLVADDEWISGIRGDLADAGLSPEKLIGTAAPGENRQESILQGLEYIMNHYDSTDEDTVLVHDAARPSLSEDLIHRCYTAFQGHDGVMPALPMKDTVYRSEDGKSIAGLLNRSEIYAGQAPELFSLKKYYEANMCLTRSDLLKINGASEPAVTAGMDIVMIAGDESNYKITTEADLKRFREYKEG